MRRWTRVSLMITAGPLIPCLQSDVSIRVSGSDLGKRLSLSGRHVALVTVVNGTLMARSGHGRA
jgi:hypothetical protein